MKHSHLLAFLFACHLLFASTVGFSEVYRWTDKNGKVHYTDTPPPNQQHEDITAQVQPTNIDQNQDQTKKLSKIFAPKTEEEKQLERRQHIEERQRAAAQKKECDQARRLYDQVKNERYYMVGEDGEGYDVSKEEAKQTRQQVEQFLQENC